MSNDYFWESIVTTRTSHNANGKALYLNATLWDGQVCEGGGTCCKFNNPPWFTKNLHQLNSTINGIELQLCTNNGPSNLDIHLSTGTVHPVNRICCDNFGYVVLCVSIASFLGPFKKSDFSNGLGVRLTQALICNLSVVYGTETTTVST